MSCSGDISSNLYKRGTSVHDNLTPVYTAIKIFGKECQDCAGT